MTESLLRVHNPGHDLVASPDRPDRLLIGGLWRDATGSGTFAVEDPATGEPFAAVADATAADAIAALDAASAAQSAWGQSPPRVRSEILRRASDLLVARADGLADLITREMGKPIAESRAEVQYAADYWSWFAGEALRIEGRYGVDAGGAGRMLVMRRPVGPCLLITPWNFPAAMGARKIGPAIAAGCTMVVKPAPQAPLTTLALARILGEAGLPDGVLNVVTSTDGAAIMAPLIADGRARKLSFTGSTRVGRQLIAQSADRVLRTSMELGGNAPFLVFEDADLDEAIDGAVVAKMRNVGEACTAANRFYVHESVAERFAAGLAERMQALTVGPGAAAGTEVGPLIDETQRTRVAELVDDAVARGARVLCGGRRGTGPGYFYPPTVLVDVAPDARVLHEEIFGPVAPVVAFREDAEAIRLANATEHGLVAYVFTADLERAWAAMEQLETGMVGVNQGLVANVGAPFGGVKQSGFGREGGREGIEEYLETKYVALRMKAVR